MCFLLFPCWDNQVSLTDVISFVTWGGGGAEIYSNYSTKRESSSVKILMAELVF